ncbi:hypothetical protein K491DRAFT_698670 [Lophiostoma macrostomum CBS 122681]|uniref:ThuA-like domain-containing protein n=1 Tax=Lophiostoma macrostomum CBS 122681 TaxID=1314788 RepID=A0A6A6SRG8_9PLEO|nr:hypothetical protein K491DRAFT_698670 [Lophiostoma macrostomum CBS 122681]
MPNDAWYGQLIGAHFDSHPAPEAGDVISETENAGHYILSVGQNEERRRSGWLDEWYEFKQHPRGNEKLRVLLKRDQRTSDGVREPRDQPLAWYQEFEGGRVMYTALGHFSEAWGVEWFAGIVERGILWAARREGGSSEAVSEVL